MRWLVPSAMTAVLVLSAGLRRAEAELTWETKRIAVRAGLEQKSVNFNFPYKNTGPTPVRILATEASCGCMISDVPGAAIPPGQSGVLHLSMAFEGRTGVLNGSLTVKTDSPSCPVEQLSVTVAVPTPVVVHPARIFWKKGERLSPRSVLLTVTDPDRSTIELVNANNSFFSATLEAGDARGSHRIVIQVTDTSRAATAMLTVRTKTEGISSDSLIFVAVK